MRMPNIQACDCGNSFNLDDAVACRKCKSCYCEDCRGESDWCKPCSKLNKPKHQMNEVEIDTLRLSHRATLDAVKSLEARIAKLEGKSEIPTNPKDINQEVEYQGRIYRGNPESGVEYKNVGEDEWKPLKPEEPKKVRPRADVDDLYYFISDRIVHEHLEGGFTQDTCRYNIGNYYLTREEAEQANKEQTKKALALQRIKDWMMAKGYEFEPDWNNLEGKCWPEYDYKKCEWVWRASMECRPLGVPFFLRWNDRDKFMRECEEDLNILIGIIK